MTEIERRTVAIVDDDDAVRDSLRFLLEGMGHRTVTFASAAEFLDADPQHLTCLKPGPSHARDDWPRNGCKPPC
jgi:CheY-like chemotaxis protein